MNGMLRRRAYTLLASVLMLLTVLAAVAHSQDAAPAPLAPEEYAATVRAAATLLQSDPAALDAAQRQLVAVEQVELRSGEVVTVAPVLGDAGGDLDGVAAQARLQIVTQQLDAAGADATSARLALMETVLASPAFQNRESWLDQVRRWLANLFQQWIGDTEPNVTPTPVSATLAQIVGWGAVVAGSVLLIVLLARWLQTLLRAFVGDAVKTATDDDAAPTTPAAARAAASQLAERGDYRAAVRQLYLAALLTLQDRRIVVRDPSLTNREVLARTPAAHPVHAPLAAVVEVFDDVWYGVHEPDQATFVDYRAAVDDLERRAVTPETQEPAS